jgi:hypothetical protein
MKKALIRHDWDGFGKDVGKVRQQRHNPILPRWREDERALWGKRGKSVKQSNGNG